MIALDYIINNKKEKKIPCRHAPVIRILVKLSISQKYNEAKFDSELIDLLELSDIINGVVK